VHAAYDAIGKTNANPNPPFAIGKKQGVKNGLFREFYKNKNRRFYRWFAFGISYV